MKENRMTLEQRFNKESVAMAYDYAEKLLDEDANKEGAGVYKDLIAISYLQGAVALADAVLIKLGLKS